MKVLNVMRTNAVLHFLLIGLLFYWAEVLLLGGQREDQSQQVLVQAKYVDKLVEERLVPVGSNYAVVRSEVYKKLIEEEVLFREALKLKLHLGDEVVRRHLINKMKFVIENSAAPDQPDTEKLVAWWRNHGDRYANPARYSVFHLYFSRGSDVDISALSSELNNSATMSVEWDQLSDPFYQGNQLTNLTVQDLTVMMGSPFADAVQRLQPSQWSQPVTTRFGTHLILLKDAVKGKHLPFAEVKSRVYQDYFEAEQQRLRKESIAELVAQYDVVYE